MIKLHTIYPTTQDTFHFLYALLEERDGDVNISHKLMPSWGDHVDFVCSVPYKHWWLVLDGSERVGAAYLTKQNEIGIFILKAHQKRGYGTAAVKKIIEMFPGQRLLANVNPKNERSKKLFESVGGKIIQHTYGINA